MKTFVLTGRLTHDPERREVQVRGETRVLTDLRIASRTGRPNKETDFFTVTAWGKNATNIIEHLGKGRLVRIDGHSEHREVDDGKGGRRHYYHDIVDRIEYLDFPDEESPAANGDAASGEPDTSRFEVPADDQPADEEVPF